MSDLVTNRIYMADYDDWDIDNDHRWSSADPFNGICRDASGRIVHPTDPDELKIELEIEAAWNLFFDTGDDSKLIEIGLFPNPDED